MPDYNNTYLKEISGDIALTKKSFNDLQKEFRSLNSETDQLIKSISKIKLSSNAKVEDSSNKENEDKEAISNIENVEYINNKIKVLDEALLTDRLAIKDTLYKSITSSNDKISKSSNDSLGNLSSSLKLAETEINNLEVATDKSNTKINSMFNALEINASSLSKTFGSISNSVMSIVQDNWNANIKDLSEYDNAIEESKNKQIEALEALEEKYKESNEIEKELYIEKLNEEYERAIEANDMLSTNAIENRLKELTEGSEIDNKEAALKKKKEEEEKKVLAQTNYDISVAEYNKAKAEHDNEIALAEVKKNKAIADATLGLANATIQAAIMPLTAGASGGIIGFTAGAIMAGAALTAVASAVSGITNATQSLDAVKANPPTPPAPPQFAYGTGGYTLREGESAIVGEMGREIVRNKGGDLEVISTERTKEISNSNSININNFIVEVKEFINADQVIDILNELKSRNFKYALQ